MALESVTDTPEQTREADSFVDLWGTINQIESVLDVVNDGFLEMMEDLEPAQRKYLLNRTHNLLGAAQALTAELASKTGVR